MHDEDTNDDLLGGTFPEGDDDLLLEEDLDLDTPLKFDEEEEDPDSRFH